MDDLTPYDTGERATPIPWVSFPSAYHWFIRGRDPEDFGNVDFDDDEGRTITTIHLSRRDDGGYTIHIMPMADDVTIEWHGESGPKIHKES